MSMYALFHPLKDFIKKDKTAIDNEVFRAHYRHTVFILILCTVLLTAKQFFGDPITCHVRGETPGLKDLISTYCWMHGTYTLKVKEGFEEVERIYGFEETGWIKRNGGNRQKNAQAHPGFGTYQEHKHEKIYHFYYQWVCLLLFLQAVFFYFPRYLWKKMEGGRVSICTKDMTGPEPDTEAQSKRLANMIENYNKFKSKNNSYAMKFLFVELVNLMNVVGQMFLMDKFMGHRFMDYGLRLYSFYTRQEEDSQVDPMQEIFPKMTKCDFYMHSSVGHVDNIDVMCLLPLNIVNEKIFLGMWIWLVILITITSHAVLYRMLILLVPDLRSFMLWGDGSQWQHVAEACRDGQYGDWFLLRLMSKNVDPTLFGQFLAELNLKKLVDNNGKDVKTQKKKTWWLPLSRSKKTHSLTDAEEGRSLWSSEEEAKEKKEEEEEVVQEK
jgi:hypothetical protein